jgi:hypothetical protein
MQLVHMRAYLKKVLQKPIRSQQVVPRCLIKTGSGPPAAMMGVPITMCDLQMGLQIFDHCAV